MSFVRHSQEYRPPLQTAIKSVHASPAVTPNSTQKKHDFNFQRQNERSVSPLNSSRRNSIGDKISDVMKLNDRLRDESDYWHRKALEKDKMVNDIELKRLIQMCEHQVIELRNTKHRAELSEQKVHELQRQLTNSQYDRGQQMQTHQRSQINPHHLDTIQQSHIAQIKVLNEQIAQLQMGLVSQASDIESIIQPYQENEDMMLKQLQEQEDRIDFLQENTQRELKQLTQSKDQQLSQMSKINNDLRHQMQQLEQGITQENQKYKSIHLSLLEEDNARLMQEISDREKQYDDNIAQVQMQHEHDTKLMVHAGEVDCIKKTYQSQLDQLLEQVDKLREVLSEKISECDLNKQGVDQLTGYLEQAEVNEIELMRELEQWNHKYEDLEQHCQNEITRIDEQTQQYIQELQTNKDEQIASLEHQLSSYQEIIEQRMKEVADHKHLKNDLTRKLNDNNAMLLLLESENEQLKSKFFEQQRQQEVEEQVREDIKRSQNDQLHRSYEVKVEQLESENRNLTFLLEGKSRECEEWKMTYLRGRSSVTPH